MAGPTTIFQTGNHASRPAASSGAVWYWCTTHSKVYRSDGSAWADLQDLSGFTTGGLSDPMTTRGDTIYRNSSNTTARLALGAVHTRPGSDGTDLSFTYPDKVIRSLTNKSGGSVAAGDVVIIDTSNDEAFTTTTTGRSETTVGVALATIASNSAGPVQLAGYTPLVNVPASVTRGHYVETHTVAKQATGNSTRRSGSLGQFLTGGTTPTAVLWGVPDQTASGGGGGVTSAYLGYNTVGATEESATVNHLYAKSVTPGADCILQSVEIYTRETTDSTQSLTVGLYDNNAGVLGKLLAINFQGQLGTAMTNNATFGDSSSTSIARWLAAPLAYKLTGSTTYWIAWFWTTSGSPTPRQFYDSGSDRTYTSGGGFLADGGRYTETDTTKKYSVRALTIS